MDKLIKKQAVYIGRRISENGKLCYFWLNEEVNKSFGWAKQIAPAQIGQTYTLTFNEAGDLFVTGENAPVYVEKWPHIRQKEWSALDIACSHEHATKKAIKKLRGSNSEYEQAMKPIKELLDRLSNHTDRTAFINKVVSDLWRRAT